MNSANDTIAAIATAPGESGIAVVRISGPLSLNIVNGIFQRRGGEPFTAKGGALHHGYITSSDGAHEKLDEVILLIFNKPKSYTREDVVEIHTHGGRICAQRILRAILSAGARIAEPGEFTKRAFLNGRIDLLQAEAVADLISARSDKAASSAIEQLTGGLTRSLTSIYDACIHILGSVEGSLDFPEDEVPAPILREMQPELEGVSLEIKKLLATWDEGRFLRDGALVVICGLPNAGKSTVFNNLLKAERAIVSEQPGTTRDFIEEPMTLDGIPIRLVDTAGLRSSDCSIETEGVRRARELMSRADLFLYIVDVSLPQSKEDLAELSGLPSRNVLVILNKSDLAQKVASTDFKGFACIACSATSSQNQEKLREAVLHKLRTGEGSSGAHISERHRILLMSALSEIEKAQSLLAGGTGSSPSLLEQHECAENADLSLVAIHIRAALDSLGKITGKIYCNDLLDNVFRRFCIGK